jgi:two-component system, NarL family, sensor histidine kinase DesK
VLVPVLREALTNILRHSAATTCVIKVTADEGVLSLHVGNDGVAGQAADDQQAAAAGGRGLVNLESRVRATGGRLACQLADGRFSLTAQVPLPTGRPRPATGWKRRRFEISGIR